MQGGLNRVKCRRVPTLDTTYTASKIGIQIGLRDSEEYAQTNGFDESGMHNKLFGPT